MHTAPPMKWDQSSFIAHHLTKERLHSKKATWRALQSLFCPGRPSCRHSRGDNPYYMHAEETRACKLTLLLYYQTAQAPGSDSRLAHSRSREGSSAALAVTRCTADASRHPPPHQPCVRLGWRSKSNSLQLRHSNYVVVELIVYTI